MNEDLLDYFNRELEYFRKSSVTFAERNSKIAGRLKNLEVGEHADPHVSRLIEAFAFLNARLRLKLEDEFPELCQAMLNVLYPEYLSPFPSCAMVAFSSNKACEVARNTELQTPAIDGEPCRFRTCYSVQVWPFKIQAAGLEIAPFESPSTSLTEAAKGIMRIDLRMSAPDLTFGKLPLQRIRFHLNGDSRHIYDLYELLFNNVLGVALATSASDRDPIWLKPSCILPVGFAEDESLLSYSARSRMGFHLLREFFVFPEKFCFFDLVLGSSVLQRLSEVSTLKLFFYFDALHPRLSEFAPFAEFGDSPHTSQFIVLGATPIVNLFEKTAEPIILSSTTPEYRVVPDATRPLANEVFSVDRVWVNTESKHFEVHPFYSADHHLEHDEWPLFWFMNRRDAGETSRGPVTVGTDAFLSLVGFDGRMLRRSDLRTLDVTTTCFNRDYPSRLANPRFMLSGKDSIVQTYALTRPRETSRPRLTDGLHWQLISHLNLNHIALTNDEQGVATLQELLRLYNFSSKKSVNQMISGVVRTESKRIVGRVGGEISSGFCRGTGITITLDRSKFSGGGEYLFGAVLERFLAMYTTINSFTKTTIETQQGDDETKTFAWPPRSGDGELI